MKLDVPFKVVGDIDASLTRAFTALFTPEDWLLYDYRKPQGNMSDCSSIVLRHSSEYSTSTIRDMPLKNKYMPALQPVLDHLRNFYVFDEYVAFLAQVCSNGVIGDHADSGEFLEKISRVHIPIVTNDLCMYRVDRIDAVNMKVGKIYEIDNMRVHGVTNKGTEARVHLIVNLYPA
jgi:hypothetical protein